MSQTGTIDCDATSLIIDCCLMKHALTIVVLFCCAMLNIEGMRAFRRVSAKRPARMARTPGASSAFTNSKRQVETRKAIVAIVCFAPCCCSSAIDSCLFCGTRVQALTHVCIAVVLNRLSSLSSLSRTSRGKCALKQAHSFIGNDSLALAVAKTRHEEMIKIAQDFYKSVSYASNSRMHA